MFPWPRLVRIGDPFFANLEGTVAIHATTPETMNSSALSYQNGDEAQQLMVSLLFGALLRSCHNLIKPTSRAESDRHGDALEAIGGARSSRLWFVHVAGNG